MNDRLPKRTSPPIPKDRNVLAPYGNPCWTTGERIDLSTSSTAPLLLLAKKLQTLLLSRNATLAFVDEDALTEGRGMGKMVRALAFGKQYEQPKPEKKAPFDRPYFLSESAQKKPDTWGDRLILPGSGRAFLEFPVVTEQQFAPLLFLKMQRCQHSQNIHPSPPISTFIGSIQRGGCCFLAIFL
ncbi:MAG: hypothetical protein LAT58_12395 [Opitutales bacterium]|nr:hypothetical protein [Opitutales bacterium]